MKKNKQTNISKNTHSKQPKQSKSTFENTWYFDVIGLGIVVLLGCIIYSNSFDCSFHFDDYDNIVKNLEIRNLYDFKTWWNFDYRPVAMFTFALNYHFNKLDVWGYHFVNLIIHLVNSLLVCWLTNLIFSTKKVRENIIYKHKNKIALVSGLMFVSHPLATESVTYLVQRMASLAALFYFLSIALYLKSRLCNYNKILRILMFFGSMASAFLAIKTKENSYTLPFVIILIELFFFQTKKVSFNFKSYRLWLYVFILLGFIGIVVLKYKSTGLFESLQPDEHNDFKLITTQNYLFTQFNVIIKYIQLLFLPINQNFDYDIPLSNIFFELKTIGSLLILLSIIGLAVFLFRKNRIISFGIFWFFLTISIESSIIVLNDPIMEHRTYLPSYGFFLILSAFLFGYLWDKYKYVVLTIVGILIGSNSILTYERNIVWKNEITFWNDMIIKSPNKARCYVSRGYFLNKEKKYNLALNDFNKAIEIKPAYSEAYNNRGDLFMNESNFDMALYDYNKAINLKANLFKTYSNQGIILEKMGRNEDALKSFNKALEINNVFIEGFINRGNLFHKINNYDKALLDFNRAILLQPSNSLIYFNRAITFAAQKRYVESISDNSKVIELKPDYANAFCNRGTAEYYIDNKESACRDWERAASLGYQPAGEMLNKYCK